MNTKDIIFRELKDAESNGEFVSGEKLAEACGVSRAAIWKGINALRKSGCEIEAVTNRGYRLTSAADILTEENVRFHLPAGFPYEISVFDNIDSTNTECKRRCVEAGVLRNAGNNLTRQGEKLHMSSVIAASQTNGRGRLGREFYSPDKSGIYLSIIYSPESAEVTPARMTVSAAVAVCRAIKKLYGIESSIKWVNDIFVGGKKVCGILTEGIANFETASIDAAVIGIGINMTESTDGFPKEIASVAGAISDASSGVTRSAMAAKVIEETLSLLTGGLEKFADIIEEYKSHSLLIGREVLVKPVINDESQAYEATVTDIDTEARLVVKDRQGNERFLSSGEVTLSSSAFV